MTTPSRSLRFTALLVLLTVLAVLGPVAAAAEAAQRTGRVVVVLADRGGGDRARAAALTAVAARAGARTAGPGVPALGVVALRPAPGASMSALLNRLRDDRAVRSARPEYRLQPRLEPNDPALTADEPSQGAPIGTPVQWAIARQRLPQAWEVARGFGARVGVIDSGVDGGHPDLAGKVDRAVDQGGGPPTQDSAGHGTHVSSLACATTNDGIGLAGTGYDCRLIVERSDFSETSIARSIVDATDNGADAINMSFGIDGSTPPSDAIRAALDYAVAREVVLVAAAANEAVEEQGEPANMLQPTGTGPDLMAGIGLSVTAADFSNARAPGAGRGTQVSLASYGSFGTGGPRGIFAAFPANFTEIEMGVLAIPPAPPCSLCRTTFAGDRRYAYLQGTSMAAPQVAGIAALIKRLNPDLRALEIVRMLKETATSPAWEPELGWGIVDAGAAVEAARVVDHILPISRLKAPSRSKSRRIRLKWTGSDPTRPGLIPSGVRRYEVFAASARGGGFRLIARTKRRSVRFTGKPGTRYRFYTVAIDGVGNRESPPSRPDASTRVMPRR